MKMKPLVLQALSETKPSLVSLFETEWSPTPRASTDVEIEIAELNAFWHHVLWHISELNGAPTLEIRRSLIQTSNPDEWIRVFKRDVVPFLEQHSV